jgi:TRAP-type C4-dicarboxylate transport system substrate-binding protein
MVIVNGDSWDGLDSDTQAVIETAAANAETACWTKAEELATWYVEQFTENGMTVGELEGEVLDGFKAVGDELRADWLERSGEAGAEIVEAFEALEAN